jgi:hypothetical protein
MTKEESKMTNSTVALKSLKGVDWAGQKKVEINGDGIPADTTVGEILAEMVRTMQLPHSTPYAGYYQDRKLNRADTVEEAGLQDEGEILIAPEVTAG